MAKQFILKGIVLFAVLYVAGFVWVMAEVASGYPGGDALSEHYRHVLQMVVK